ncbi:MAG: acyl-CoA thioesterase [Bacteroidales bacterium]|nr:acyl-CoA thioesterase [Bacteroidales bacterium]
MDRNRYVFTHDMKVRDYECDLQGIVNNANYQHYMEHARHEFLESLGLNFGRLHEQGIDAMVAKITIEYKLPLVSGDRFAVGINLQRQGAKILFLQDIYRLSDGRLCTKGVVETICVQDGRLTRGEIFDEVFKDYL